MKLSVKFSLLALAVLLLSSCSNKDYLKVIPANASFVASVNLRSISEKSDFANSSLMDMLDKSMNSMDNDNAELLQKYIDDPMATGIDLSAPVYVFYTEDELFGVVMKVGSKGDLEDTLDKLRKSARGEMSRPKEKKGVMCGTIGEINYAYNGDALLLLMGTGYDSEVSDNTLARMMNGDGKSFVDTKGYDEITSVDDRDAALYIGLKNLPEKMQRDFREYNQNSPLKTDDIELLFSLDCKKGAAVMSMKWWGRTKEAQKLIDEAKDNARTIDGEYLGRVPDDLLLWVGCGANGKKMLEMMKGNEQMRELMSKMNEMMDVDNIVGALDGDLSFALSSSVLEGYNDFYYDYHRPDINFSFNAKVDGAMFKPAFNKMVSTMNDEGLTMTNVGTDTYKMTYDGLEIQWGLKGDNFYVDTEKAYRQFQGGTALKEYESDIKKSYYFVYYNLQKNLQMLDKYTNKGLRQMGVDLSGVKAIILKMTSHDELVLELEMDDDSENILRQIIR